MFKIGHYYRVVHKNSAGTKKCIIKVVKYIGCSIDVERHKIWLVKVIQSYSSYMGRIGTTIRWYEDYCFNVEELTEAEILACIL